MKSSQFAVISFGLSFYLLQLGAATQAHATPEEGLAAIGGLSDKAKALIKEDVEAYLKAQAEQQYLDNVKGGLSGTPENNLVLQEYQRIRREKPVFHPWNALPPELQVIVAQSLPPRDRVNLALASKDTAAVVRTANDKAKLKWAIAEIRKHFWDQSTQALKNPIEDKDSFKIFSSIATALNDLANGDGVSLRKLDLNETVPNTGITFQQVIGAAQASIERLKPIMAKELHEALAQQDEDKLKRLIKEGVSPNWTTPNSSLGLSGWSPLAGVVEYGNSQGVQWLLNTPGIDVNQPGSTEGLPPLLAKCRNNYIHLNPNCERAYTLLAKDPRTDVNATDETGRTALFYTEYPRVIEALLKNPKIDVGVADSSSKYHSTPLRKAAYKRHNESLKLLLKNESVANQLNGELPEIISTILRTTNDDGHPGTDTVTLDTETIRILLDTPGIDKKQLQAVSEELYDFIRYDGRAVAHAAYNNLVARGFHSVDDTQRVDLSTEQKKYDWVVGVIRKHWYGHWSGFRESYLKLIPVVEELVASGKISYDQAIYPDGPTFGREYKFVRAIIGHRLDELARSGKQGDQERRNDLISRGADPAWYIGNPELFDAAQKGDIPRLQHLLSQPGLNINVTDMRGETPLVRAVKSEQVEAVKLFLARGSRPSHSVLGEDGWSGETPLFAAFELIYRGGEFKSIVEIMKALLDAPGISKADVESLYTNLRNSRSPRADHVLPAVSQGIKEILGNSQDQSPVVGAAAANSAQ